jgi:hypothetical protein
VARGKGLLPEGENAIAGTITFKELENDLALARGL